MKRVKALAVVACLGMAYATVGTAVTIAYNNNVSGNWV